MLFRVDLQAQYFAHREQIDAAVSRVLQSGRYTLGHELDHFEREFAEYLQVPEVVGVANGTQAIVLALQALGVCAGSEVITTAFTAIPTLGAILEAGAIPVLVDIDPDTYLIDLEAIVAAVTPKTKAVMPVHIFGNVFDVPALRARLRSDILIIEDAAQAHGSRLDKVYAGTMGDIATFSFYPTKNLGCCGDGGAIVCRDATIAAHLRVLRNHGMRDKDICATLGTNSRLDELQAAILRAKLPHLDAMNAARARLVARYLDVLPSNQFRSQKIAARVTTNWHVFELRFGGDRDLLVAHLETCGVQSNIYYVVPHHLQPALVHLGYGKGSLPQTERICEEVIALPLYPEMSDSVIDTVASAIRDFCGPTMQPSKSKRLESLPTAHMDVRRE
jgi:dTDP-4-amino-4,6-dideoxygalactose transaminase